MSPKAARRTQPLSIVSLIAGVVGVVTFLVAPTLGNRVPIGFPLGILTVAGPVALITGFAALRVIRREHLGGLWFALLGTMLGFGAATA